MDIKQEKEFEIKQEELIIKDEFISATGPECTSLKNSEFQSTVDKHGKTHDQSNRKIRDIPKYLCAHCPYTTMSKHSLRIHVKSHLNGKPFACGYCDFKTKLKKKFEKHLLAHTGEKPHQCKLCDYKATTKSSLKRHLLVHTGEKPHQCKLCDYRTAQKSYLKRHLLVHTGEKPYQCTLCDYKATQKAHLNKHQLVHIGLKVHFVDYLFICHVCEKSFKTKYAMTSHLRTHTEEEFSQIASKSNLQNQIEDKNCQLNEACSNEDTMDSKNFLLEHEIVPNECIDFNSIDLVIKEESSDCVL